MANDPTRADEYGKRGPVADFDDRTAMASGGMKAVLDRRPPIPNDISRYIAYWWDATQETPEFRDYRRQVNADNHDLYPFDVRRKKRNDAEGEKAGLRSKADSRIVQNPHVFRASQRAVAMTIPDNWSFDWQGKTQVPSPTRQETPLGTNQQMAQFGDTLGIVEKCYLDEIDAQSILEDWVRDATFYRAGILKAWYQRDYDTDPLAQNRLHDMQDEVGELQSLMADFARGRFDKNDGRYRRMIEMHQAIIDNTQLKVWQGICAETVPLDRFRLDPNVRSLDSFYSAKWMSEDLVFTKRDLLGRFPYELDPEGKEDGSNPKGFIGIHPDDLSRSRHFDNSGDRLKKQEEERRQVDRDTRQTRLTDEQTAYDSRDDDDTLFTVRQVWIRDEGKVLILCEGLEYPAGEWEPQDTPAQWFPYFPLVLNRQHGTWFGRSDTELASDEQARMNQKQTDAEKMRELAKPRGVYNKGALDEQEAVKISEIAGGEIRGLNMQGDKLQDNFEWLSFQFDPTIVDTYENQQMFDKMVGFPEAFLGNASADIKFATQAQLSAAGTNIMVRSRQALVRRALANFLTSMAEVLIQVLDETQAKLIGGIHAFWPRLYGDREAGALKQELMEAVTDQVKTEMAEVANDPEPALRAMEFPGIEAPAIRAQALYEEKALELWGQLEPMTRDSLFKRLKVKVKTDPDGLMAKQAKFQQMATMSDFLGNLGVRIAPKAAGQLLGQVLDMEDEVDDLVQVDPNVAVADLHQAMVSGDEAMAPESIRMLAALGAMAHERLKEMAVQEGQAAAETVAQEATSAVGAGIEAEGALREEEADEVPPGPVEDDQAGGLPLSEDTSVDAPMPAGAPSGE